MTSRTEIFRATRKLLLSCAAGVALATAAEAQSTTAVQGNANGVSPLFGRIHAFYGDIGAEFGRIHAFFSNINPLFSNVSPFFGNVSGFWGNITPFTQPTDPAVTSFYGNADPFWGSNSPYANKSVPYGNLNGFWTSRYNSWMGIMGAWSQAQTPNDAQNIANSIQNNLINPTNSFWNNLVPKSNGGAAAIVKNDLAAAGIGFVNNNTIDPQSLLSITQTQQASLFLNIYDDLMNYAGTGHVDWWMGAIHWTPALAQTQGSTPIGGSPPTIGMLDFVISQGQNVPKQITQYGSTVFNDGHGAAVGSLLIGATDGSGILGMLPANSANVKVYNPYDSTGTTNWTDVGTGVATLVQNVFTNKTTPVGVLNASLGVPGWTLNPGWNDALANAGAFGHNLVIAAGNDGTMQTQNVPWDFTKNPSLIIVGSVGADGTISNFSNTPGEACLLPTNSSSTICSETNKLKYRFIVAPGELILVSDGMGGHYRQSGTSLAAPLVSGAIAMLQNRWPWLSNYPDETSSIILKSATPLGTNPGADPVYGVGELNVAASQSPLNWANMVYLPGTDPKGVTPTLATALTAPVKAVLGVATAVLTPTAPAPAPAPAPAAANPVTGQAAWATIAAAGIPLSAVSTQLASGNQSSWNSTGLFYTAFEQVGNTYRDFYIPLASKLVGQTVTTQGGGQAYQGYLSSALHAQAGHFASLDAPAPDGLLANGFARSAAPAGMVGAMQLRVNVTTAVPSLGLRNTSGNNLYETGAALVGEKTSFAFGYGNGASALDSNDNFAFRSDHDLATGGANPVLGLASGGGFLGGRTAVTSRLSLGIGMSQRDVWRNPLAFGLGPQTTGSWVNRYAATAQTMTADYAVSPRLVTHFGLTRLDERNALLGTQSIDRSDLSGGSVTTAATMGFDVRLSHGLTLSGSGTVSRTDASGGQITTNKLTDAAAEFALTKNRVFGKHDQLRLVAATPLHAIGGGLRYSSLGVVDRETGAIGLVTQSIDAQTQRMPLAGEVMYGRRLGRGEVSLFGRFQRAGQLTQGDLLGTMGGVQLQFGL